MTQRPFRFGYQLSAADDADPVSAAVRAESLGFDVVLVTDHVGDGIAPMPTLGAIAQATESIRLGTLVLNNDMRNPVQLAWEATTLDRLSGGRFELGLGAGHTRQEWSATGIERMSANARKRRLAESVEIVRRLLDGENVDFSGDYYEIDGAHVGHSTQERLPILVGGNGEALLTHAGANADIIGLQGLGRTLEDGHRHVPNWNAEWLTEQVSQIRAGAGARFESLELNALVQYVNVTNQRGAALTEFCSLREGLSIGDASSSPYLMVGSLEEIVVHLQTCCERWGITYFIVRDPAFARVIDYLKVAT